MSPTFSCSPRYGLLVSNFPPCSCFAFFCDCCRQLICPHLYPARPHMHPCRIPLAPHPFAEPGKSQILLMVVYGVGLFGARTATGSVGSAGVSLCSGTFTVRVFLGAGQLSTQNGLCTHLSGLLWQLATFFFWGGGGNTWLYSGITPASAHKDQA